MKKILFVLLFVLILFCFLYLQKDINTLYKENWNVDLPNPKKIDTLINQSSIDITSFQIMHYKKNDINKLIKKGYLEKITETNLKRLNLTYKLVIEDYFLKFLSNKEKKIFKSNFVPKKIFVKNNYYMLFEKNVRNEKNYAFLLVVLDTNKDVLYAIESTS